MGSTFSASGVILPDAPSPSAPRPPLYPAAPAATAPLIDGVSRAAAWGLNAGQRKPARKVVQLQRGRAAISDATGPLVGGSVGSNFSGSGVILPDAPPPAPGPPLYPLGVMVACVPLTVTKGEVQLAFAPFGAMKDMGLHPTNSKKNLNVFVEFNVAASAEAALQQRRVILGGREVTVRPLSVGKYMRLSRKGVLVLTM